MLCTTSGRGEYWAGTSWKQDTRCGGYRATDPGQLHERKTTMLARTCDVNGSPAHTTLWYNASSWMWVESRPRDYKDLYERGPVNRKSSIESHLKSTARYEYNSNLNLESNPLDHSTCSMRVTNFYSTYSEERYQNPNLPFI